MPSVPHVQRVRMLYKYILRLHRGLPPEMRAIGDSYVQEEFRRHKNSEMDIANKFLKEWTDYCVLLTKQLSRRKVRPEVGAPLPRDMVDLFSEEQLGQLLELRTEATKSKDRENPSGYNSKVPEP